MRRLQSSLEQFSEFGKPPQQHQLGGAPQPQFGGGGDDEAAAAAAALVAQLSAANDSKALLEALAALPKVWGTRLVA